MPKPSYTYQAVGDVFDLVTENHLDATLLRDGGAKKIKGKALPEDGGTIWWSGERPYPNDVLVVGDQEWNVLAVDGWSEIGQYGITTGSTKDARDDQPAPRVTLQRRGAGLQLTWAGLADGTTVSGRLLNEDGVPTGVDRDTVLESGRTKLVFPRVGRDAVRVEYWFIDRVTYVASEHVIADIPTS